MMPDDVMDIAKLLLTKRQELLIDIYHQDHNGNTVIDDLRAEYATASESVSNRYHPYDEWMATTYAEMIALLEEEYAKDGEPLEPNPHWPYGYFTRTD